MRLRKSANVVLLIPSGVGIVARERRHVRSGLDHAERHRGTGKHVATACNTEQRVDIGGRIGGMLAAQPRRKQKNWHKGKQ
jgi:hypothetical protein